MILFFLNHFCHVLEGREEQKSEFTDSNLNVFYFYQFFFPSSSFILFYLNACFVLFFSSLQVRSLISAASAGARSP